MSKPALFKKGLLRGESLSGHPEGAKAPEGPPTILMGRRPERSEGCLANARQDKRVVTRQDRWVERDYNSKVAQLESRKCLLATQNRDERSNHTTFQTLSLRSVIKYTKALLLRGFSEK